MYLTFLSITLLLFMCACVFVCVSEASLISFFTLLEAFGLKSIRHQHLFSLQLSEVINGILKHLLICAVDSYDTLAAHCSVVLMLTASSIDVKNDFLLRVGQTLQTLPHDGGRHLQFPSLVYSHITLTHFHWSVESGPCSKLLVWNIAPYMCFCSVQVKRNSYLR